MGKFTQQRKAHKDNFRSREVNRRYETKPRSPVHPVLFLCSINVRGWLTPLSTTGNAKCFVYISIWNASVCWKLVNLHCTAFFSKIHVIITFSNTRKAVTFCLVNHKLFPVLFYSSNWFSKKKKKKEKSFQEMFCFVHKVKSKSVFIFWATC